MRDQRTFEARITHHAGNAIIANAIGIPPATKSAMRGAVLCREQKGASDDRAAHDEGEQDADAEREDPTPATPPRRPRPPLPATAR